MFTYEVEIPGKGTFEVSSKTELTNEQAYQYASSQVTEPVRKPTFAEASKPEALTGLIGRAFIQGATALPNIIADPFYRLAGLTPPQQGVRETLTAAGLPEFPATTTGRALEAGTEALVGAGGQIATATKAATTAATRLGRGVAERFAAQPAAQVTAAAPAAIAAQTTTEVTGSPIAGLAAGLATGAATGVRPGRTERGATLENIKTAAENAYKMADEAELVIRPNAIKDIATQLRSVAMNSEFGYDPQLHPKVARVLDRLEEEGVNYKTLREMDKLRQIIKDPGKDFQNPTQQSIAKEMTEKFDELLVNLDPSKTLYGKKDAAMSAIGQARKLYTTQKKLQTIEDLVDNAAISAGGYSQSGMDNALRIQFASLAKNKKRMAQFNKTEQAEIATIAKGGGTLEQMMRFIGKFAVRGPVTGAVQTVIGGTIPGGAVGTIIASEAAKRGAEAMRQQNVQRLMEQISLGRTPEGRAFELLPATTVRGLLSSQYGME